MSNTTVLPVGPSGPTGGLGAPCTPGCPVKPGTPVFSALPDHPVNPWGPSPWNPVAPVAPVDPAAPVSPRVGPRCPVHGAAKSSPIDRLFLQFSQQQFGTSIRNHMSFCSAYIVDWFDQLSDLPWVWVCLNIIIRSTTVVESLVIDMMIVWSVLVFIHQIRLQGTRIRNVITFRA